MKFRHPYLLIGLIFFTLIFSAAIFVPNTVFSVADSSLISQELSTLGESSGVISSRDDGIEISSANLPWSLERMDNAQPYPIPEISSLPGITRDLKNSTGEPGIVLSVQPASSQLDEWPAYPYIDQTAESTAGYEKPAPYTRYENFDSYQVFPYSTVGVLFFKQNGLDYRCSAAVVGENALWTAGHCVHDGKGTEDGWSENVVFVPAYKNGAAPYGIWIANNLHTRLYWVNNQDLRFDIGGVSLDTNGTGQSIQEVVGSLGFAYNLGPIQHWFNFGYPSESPFDGTKMQICAGSYARLAEGFSFPNPVGMGCDMTRGSSGGPWIIQFSGKPGNANFINGNNSFRFTSDPEDSEELFSPYFGDTAWELFSKIAPESTPLSNFFLPIMYSKFD